MNHVKRAMLTQEGREQCFHFGRGCRILAERRRTRTNKGRVDDLELTDALRPCARFAEERPARKGTVAIARAEEPRFIASFRGGIDQVLLVDGYASTPLPFVLEIGPVVVKHFKFVHVLLCRYSIQNVRFVSMETLARQRRTARR